MARLIYSAIASLDGTIEDLDGRFDWAFPSEAVHTYINDLERSAGIHLYGRKMYEMMTGWETDPDIAATSPAARDFAEIWQAAEKIVFSKTLEAVVTRKTRLERVFNPEAIRTLKTTDERNFLVGGSNLAAHVFKAGLVDEIHLFLAPVVVGGGKSALPGSRGLDLRLLDERHFDNDMVFLHYQVR